MFAQPGPVPGSSVSSLPHVAPPVREEDLTAFDDYPKIRRQIFDKTLASVTSAFPYKNERFTIGLKDVRYKDTDDVPYKDQKTIILSGKSLVKPLVGKYTLTDNATGQQVSESGYRTIINVPYLTERGTYIRSGTEYSVAKQMRLVPGVYTRKTSDGMLEAQVNTKPGTGVMFRLVFEPETALFYLKMGTRRLPFYPIATRMGLTDRQMQTAWGDEVFNKNKMKATAPHALGWVAQLGIKKQERLDRLAQKAAPVQGMPVQDAPEALDKQAAEDPVVQEFFGRMELDPQAVSRSLGQGYSKVNPDLILNTTGKLLKLSRGETPPDSRDSLAYQTVHDFSDFLADKIKNDQNGVFKKSLWKASNKNGDLSVIPTGVLDKHVDHVFYSSKVAQAIEQISPMDMLNQNHRVIRLGEGAIPDVRAAPKEARNVQDSYAGFIDPVRSPESLAIGLDMYFARNTRKGPDNLMYSKFRNVKSGKDQYINTIQAADAVIGFPSEEYEQGLQFVPALIKGSKIEYVDRNRVNYMINNGDDLFSEGAQFTPFKAGVKGMRLLMGCIHPDTALLIKEMSGKIWRGPVKEYQWKSGDATLSIDEDGQTYWQWIYGVKENTVNLPALKVTLKSGRSLITTTNHAWTTLDENGHLTEILASDLSKDTAIPREGFLTIPQSNRLTEVVIQKTEYQIDVERKVTRDIHIPLDFSFGWIYGLYLAEGSITPVNGRLCPTIFAAMSPEIRTRIVDFFHKLGVYASDKSPTYIALGWKQFTEFMLEWGSRYSGLKKMSGNVFNTSDEFRQGVLSGYLAGDGCVSERRGCARVSGGTRSKQMCEDLMLLASSLGIDTCMQEQIVVDEPFYHFEVRVEHLHKLPRTYSDHKDLRLATLKGWSGMKSTDWFPVYASLHRKIISVSPRKSEFRQRSYVSQHTKATLLEKFSVEDCQWLTSSVLWDRVKSVETVADLQTSYDLDLGDRVFMCGNGIFVHNSKFLSQALPLRNREVPLVTTLDPSGVPVTEKLGAHFGAVHSAFDGKVLDVTPDSMILQTAEGKKEVPLYNNFMLARKTVYHNTPNVKIGDMVKQGDLLAYSNFTDKKGVAAPGMNLKVAYMTYKGQNFEDGNVISESAAKKLAPQLLYSEDLDVQENMSTDKNKFHIMYPKRYNMDQLNTIDDKGIVKPGTVLNPGDPMILAVQERVPSLSNLGRRITTDESVMWDHDHPGVVTDVAKTDKGYKVYVKYETPLQEADKLSVAFGGKGVISAIIPDDQMIKDSNGQPFDVLMSPLGITSRTNPAQMIAAQLGKVAIKTGKPYSLPGFGNPNLAKFAKEELTKNGLSDTEDVVDPTTGKSIPKIFTGNIYTYVLQQMAETKGKARSQGFYSQDETPGRGGSEGGKHYGDMEYSGLIGYGAMDNLRDVKLIKGQKNDDFWRAVKMGKTPMQPTTPVVYEKFKSLIGAAGVHINESPEGENLFAMTNKQAQDLTGNREIVNNKTFSATSLTPIKGGLFDPEATGSELDGNRWAYMTLPEPMLNPIMEAPVKALLGLTGKDFNAIVSGETPVNGKAGGAALQSMLSALNLEQVIRQAREDMKSPSATKRESALKKFSFAQGLVKNNVRPEDFMMTRVPVLPPKFRPISQVGDLTMVADLNHQYKNMFSSIEDFKDAKGMPTPVANGARMDMYSAYRQLIGIEDSSQEKLAQKNIGGVLQQLLGKGSPKTSFTQRKVLGSDSDMTGLAVITGNPSLRIDQVGFPEEQAWTLYEPFIIRNLVRKGMPATEAAKAVTIKAPIAYRALQETVKERPVIINRAPSLHKYSQMAVWPILTKGHTLQLSSASLAPFGADFDGNCTDFDSRIIIRIPKSQLEKFLASVYRKEES